LSRRIEEWLFHVKSAGSVTRVLAVHDQRSADALFEINDKTDLSILAEWISALYLRLGVEEYELRALDDDDRTIELFKSVGQRLVKRRRKPKT
jgi:hypothetical protein